MQSCLVFFLIALVEKTVMIFFGIGWPVSHGEGDIKGVFVVKKSACVCGIVPPPSRLAAAHFVAALFGLKRAVRGADAIIKLTHGRDGTHCPAHSIPPSPQGTSNAPTCDMTVKIRVFFFFFKVGGTCNACTDLPV